MKYYILNEQGEPVVVKNLMKWAGRYGSDPKRIVAKDTIEQSTVSTVFLGLDHAFFGGPPILWETMVFGGKLDQERVRCSGSREQAEAMHKRMVEKVKQTMKGQLWTVKPRKGK